MTRQQRLDGVIAGVLAPYLKDYHDVVKTAYQTEDPEATKAAARKGLVEMARRRFDHIRDEFRFSCQRAEILTRCCEAGCSRTASTRVGGRDYCDVHVGAAPRLTGRAA